MADTDETQTPCEKCNEKLLMNNGRPWRRVGITGKLTTKPTKAQLEMAARCDVVLAKNTHGRDRYGRARLVVACCGAHVRTIGSGVHIVYGKADAVAKLALPQGRLIVSIHGDAPPASFVASLGDRAVFVDGAKNSIVMVDCGATGSAAFRFEMGSKMKPAKEAVTAPESVDTPAEG